MSIGPRERVEVVDTNYPLPKWERHTHTHTDRHYWSNNQGENIIPPGGGIIIMPNSCTYHWGKLSINKYLQSVVHFTIRQTGDMQANNFMSMRPLIGQRFHQSPGVCIGDSRSSHHRSSLQQWVVTCRTRFPLPPTLCFRIFMFRGCFLFNYNV